MNKTLIKTESRQGTLEIKRLLLRERGVGVVTTAAPSSAQTWSHCAVSCSVSADQDNLGKLDWSQQISKVFPFLLTFT